MPKSKALIFDIDGTAIDSPSQKLPTERLNNSVRAIESNYYVCAATGRPWPFAKPVLQGMGLIDPCIISGGTQICDPKDGTILWQCNIQKADVQAIKATLTKHSGYGLVINDFSEDDYFGGGFPAEQLDTDQDMFFADYIFVPDDVAIVIAEELKAIQGIICILATAQKPGHKDIHMTNSVATKEHAVAELLARLKVDRQNAWGFGDALNDTHLFNAVGTKVAMVNAIQELKDLADEVIAPVSEDGLARYFERLAAATERAQTT
ncbi:MAG TPA: HAD-IIB family hydrolase [Candidatus Saccharimonadales bacterium]|nr:HAD-IIB family hydrolase [Candidatus Saccharimonadales bacterium]